MPEIISLLNESAAIDWPSSPEGWLGWLILLVVTGYLVRRWWEFNAQRDGRNTALLALFLVLVPITSLLGGLRLEPGPALPQPNLPIEPEGPALMVLAALPWILAAGFLGPAPAAGVAALSGFFITLLDTHNPYTILEYALIATLFGGALRQRFRTPFFRLLRHPFLVGVLLALVYPSIFLIDTLFRIGGPISARLDFAITWLGMTFLAFAGQLLFAGLIAELIAAAWPDKWGSRGELLPSPGERSLETRFQYTLGVVFIFLVILLMAGDWIVATNAARQMLQQRMADTAVMGSESIPFFLETGQNLVMQIAADPRLLAANADELTILLEEHLRAAPYFNQLFVLDEDGVEKGGYPASELKSLLPTPEEIVGFDLALQGVAFQYYPVPPVEGAKSAQVSFIQTIGAEEGRVDGVLMGRSELATNPFTKPLLSNLDSISALGGSGILVDESGRILYHQLENLLMSTYPGRMSASAQFYDETGSDGTRDYVYYQPVLGRPWAVILIVPARQAQQLALTIAGPLLALLLGLSIVVLVLLRVGLRKVTSSLHGLSVEADRIAQGELDHPLEPGGVDEIGQLRRAFEEMRVRLDARLVELNRLLDVSQGVASSLDVETAVQPILESALVTGASSARIVLGPSALPELSGSQPAIYGTGASTEQYRYLDEQILELTSRQSKVELTNPARARLLSLDPQKPIPEALLAVALRHESMYYGTLWIAYDEPHKFSEEEARFLITLAGQAALAAANGRLFLSAEIGRQRLAAILASTPDPVLVTDHQNQLLVANPAALQLLADGDQPVQGLPIEEVVSQPEIVDLLKSSTDEQRSAEIALPDGRYFYATASSVIAEKKRVGRVCVLQEITRFMELDALKSEFVATVSHDLRSPLTLMRGYATMLQMVGELNEQQTGYVRKIIASVEDMSRLVNNLLDLGRIETGIGLKLEMVSVADTVERVTGALQLQAVQKRINLSVDIPSHAAALIQADQALLQQALQNLVENAIKYTEPGGKVQLRVNERNARLIFEVVDTGIGIAPVDQARMFEKFYRGARRKAKLQRGSGLGLAIVKSIAERHGGRVWVESQLGKGSHFYLEIPLQQDEPSGEIMH